MKDKTPNRRILIGIAFIAVATFLTYLNALGNGFVYDDNFLILKNPWVMEAGHLADIFSNHTFGFSKELYAAITYRPMIFVVYRAIYALFGQVPYPFHLLNILLHTANSVMVFLVARKLLLGRDDGGEAALEGFAAPVFAALLFASHPVNSESVAWISTTAELSFTLLCLGAFFIYLKSLDAEGRTPSGISSPFTLKYRLVPAAMYFIAMLFKETAVFLPVLVLTHDLSRGGGEGFVSPARARRYLFFGVFAGIYLLIRFSVIGGMGPPMKLHPYLSGFQYFLNGAALLGEDVRMLVLPLNDYPLQLLDPVYSLSDTRALVPIVAAASASLLLIIRKRIDPLYYLASSMLFLPVLPSLYSVAISRHPYADRYLYFPSIGYALFLVLIYRGVAGSSFAKRFRAALYAVTAVFAAMVLIFSIWAAERNRFWKDDLTLRFRALEGSQANYVALHDIGAVFVNTGRPQEGLEMLKKALLLNKTSAHPDLTMLLMTHKVLAVEYTKRGMVEDAIREYNGALDLEPENIVSNYNLAMLYRERGNFGDAIELYKRALVLAKEPLQFRDIYSNLGDSYAAKGMWTEALQNYEEALKMDPADVKLMENADMARAKATGRRGR